VTLIDRVGELRERRIHFALRRDKDRAVILGRLVTP
jgi:hypothetical protein